MQLTETLYTLPCIFEATQLSVIMFTTFCCNTHCAVTTFTDYYFLLSKVEMQERQVVRSLISSTGEVHKGTQ